MTEPKASPTTGVGLAVTTGAAAKAVALSAGAALFTTIVDDVVDELPDSSVTISATV